MAGGNSVPWRKVRTPQGKVSWCNAGKGAGKPRRWKVPQKANRRYAGKGERVVQETTVRDGNIAVQGKPHLEQDQIGNLVAARICLNRKVQTQFRVDCLDE